MANWHLEKLENRITKIGWKIIERKSGDNYRISGSWVIQREKVRKIDFDGFDDLTCFPMDKAYACNLKDIDISLYFYKKGDMWKNDLENFISKLNKTN